MEKIISDYSESYKCNCPVSHLGNQRFKDYTQLYINLIGKFIYFPLKGNFDEDRVNRFIKIVKRYLQGADPKLSAMFSFIWKKGVERREKLKISLIANLYLKMIHKFIKYRYAIFDIPHNDENIKKIEAKFIDILFILGVYEEIHFVMEAGRSFLYGQLLNKGMVENILSYRPKLLTNLEYFMIEIKMNINNDIKDGKNAPIHRNLEIQQCFGNEELTTRYINDSEDYSSWHTPLRGDLSPFPFGNVFDFFSKDLNNFIISKRDSPVITFNENNGGIHAGFVDINLNTLNKDYDEGMVRKLHTCSHTLGLQDNVIDLSVLIINPRSGELKISSDFYIPDATIKNIAHLEVNVKILKDTSRRAGVENIDALLNSPTPILKALLNKDNLLIDGEESVNDGGVLLLLLSSSSSGEKDDY